MSPRLIDHDALKDLGIPLSVQQLSRREREGQFPKRIRLSHKRVAWVETEIAEWLAARIASRQPVAA